MNAVISTYLNYDLRLLKEWSKPCLLQFNLHKNQKIVFFSLKNVEKISSFVF